MEQLKWETKKVKVKDLIQLNINPRRISEEKKQKLVESLEKFNLVEIPAVNTDLQIIGGNQRVKALLLAGRGEEEIDVRFPNRKLTKKEVKEYSIISNTHAGEFDFEILDLEFADISIGELGFEIEGWDDWKNKQDTLLAGEAQEDDFDVPEGGIETDIVLGDLFEIGEHRLLCGDSTDSDTVAKLMNGEISEIVFTSPPYNAGGNENIPNSGGLKYETYTDNKSEDDYFDFLCGNINAILPHTKEIFYNIGLIEKSKRSIIRLLFQYNDIFKDIIYWNKSKVAPHIQPGIINNKIEFILCFGNGSRKFLNAQFSQGTYWNVIEGPNASGNEFAKIHKATFPLYLPENIITNFTNVNAIVMDCFCGTGTTMVAAHQLKRKCYGIELDPKYCQVIIDRMIKLNPMIKITKNGKEWNTTKIY